MSQAGGRAMRRGRESALWMVAALAALALACGGIGWALRVYTPEVCVIKASFQSCHSLGHPFTPLGDVTLAVAGAGLATALVWVVAALARARRPAQPSA